MRPAFSWSLLCMPAKMEKFASPLSFSQRLNVDAFSPLVCIKKLTESCRELRGHRGEREIKREKKRLHDVIRARCAGRDSAYRVAAALSIGSAAVFKSSTIAIIKVKGRN
jgi:hypothetical protein